MSKYEKLWNYISSAFIKKEVNEFELTFEQIKDILGFNIDHSFLKYKKELLTFGYEVIKINMKEQTILFKKVAWIM